MQEFDPQSLMADAYEDDELDEVRRKMERRALLIKVEPKLPAARNPIDGDGGNN